MHGKKELKVLHITYGFDGGGVGYVIRSYCAGGKMDGISFDIVGEDTGKKHILHGCFEKAGFGCFYVTPKKKDLPRNIWEMYSLIKNGGYDAVHVHFEEWSFLYLLIAAVCGVRTRICHAHMAYVPGSRKKPHYRLFRILIRMLATDRLACSCDAGRALYGSLPFVVLRNAVDTDRFRFSEEIREKMRAELGLQDAFVCGTVGRLSFQKDPEYTLGIFCELKKLRKDAVLVFAGKGELEKTVRERIWELGIEKDIRILGHRDDVPALMQAFDAFVLPSRFEGLGIVYIEAQAAGLQTYAPAGLVPKEACAVKDLMHFIGKEKGPAAWAEEIAKRAGTARRDTSREIKESGYEIECERKRLEQIYRRVHQR